MSIYSSYFCKIVLCTRAKYCCQNANNKIGQIYISENYAVIPEVETAYIAAMMGQGRTYSKHNRETAVN